MPTYRIKYLGDAESRPKGEMRQRREVTVQDAPHKLTLNLPVDAKGEPRKIQSIKRIS